MNTVNDEKMRVLVACEKSGNVRRAFRALGHEAFSCDLEPADDGGEHILCDHTLHLADIVEDGWDVLLAFPPCTFLNSAGLHWNNRGRGHHRTDEALHFVCMLLNAPVHFIGLENPTGCISTRLGRSWSGGPWFVKPNTGKATCPPAQIIQPHQFGEDASKATCLWLKNLPLLQPTRHIAPRIVNGKPRWANQTDSGQNKLGPSAERATIRAVTYQGVADAMAKQWSMVKQPFQLR